jgi:hypothetical protein
MSFGDLILIEIVALVAAIVAVTWRQGQWPWAREGKTLKQYILRR